MRVGGREHQRPLPHWLSLSSLSPLLRSPLSLPFSPQALKRTLSRMPSSNALAARRLSLRTSSIKSLRKALSAETAAAEAGAGEGGWGGSGDGWGGGEVGWVKRGGVGWLMGVEWHEIGWGG